MSHSILHFLFSDARAEILRALLRKPFRESFGRELARETTLALGTIQQELSQLAEVEILISRSDGFRRFYRANRKHYLFPDLQRLVERARCPGQFVSAYKRPAQRWRRSITNPKG
jgi:DNA-binding transcriptional ArsR family regulator